jgi:hypothetical protein
LSFLKIKIQKNSKIKKKNSCICSSTHKDYFFLKKKNKRRKTWRLLEKKRARRGKSRAGSRLGPLITPSLPKQRREMEAGLEL